MADKRVEEEDHVADPEGNLMLVRVVESADGGGSWLTKFAFPADITKAANRALNNGEWNVRRWYIEATTFDENPVASPLSADGFNTDLTLVGYAYALKAEVALRNVDTNATMYFQVTDIGKRSPVDDAITTSSGENAVPSTVLLLQKDATGWSADPVLSFDPDSPNSKIVMGLTGLAATTITWSIRVSYAVMA